MTVRIPRRRVLAAGLASGALAWAGAGRNASASLGVGDGPGGAGPSVYCQPATPTVAIVFGTGLAPTGTMSVADAYGKVLGKGSVLHGQAIVRVPMAANSTQQLHVTTPSRVLSVSASTTTAALDASTWRFANKRLPLPSTFAPKQLRTIDRYQVRTDVGDAYLKLRAAAAKQKLSLVLCSGYRSYQSQVGTYQQWVSVMGKAGADRESARPGYSEHQTALAIDVARADGKCTLQPCFAGTPEAKWLAAHAHEFGFILRFEQGQQPTTGYIYEAWHLRYLGPQMAADYTARGMHSLETYFGFPAAPGY